MVRRALVIIFIFHVSNITPSMASVKERTQKSVQEKPLMVSAVLICPFCIETTEITILVSNLSTDKSTVPEVAAVRSLSNDGVVIHLKNVSFPESLYGKQVFYHRGVRGILMSITFSLRRDVITIYTYIDAMPAITVAPVGLLVKFVHEGQ